MPQAHSRDHAREGRMAALYQQGKTLQEIGSEYELSRERVRQILARLGVQRRARGKRQNEGG